MVSLTLVGLLLYAAAAATGKNPITHVIVVMFENRSFDHLLGHLAKTDPRIDGLTGSQYNPLDPTNPKSPHVEVNYDAVDGGPDDPCHSFDCITQQIYGFHKSVNDTTSPVKMNGFVANAASLKGSTSFVMSAFSDTNLPILSGLARDYAVFDHWHCSCPCPTNPNREFLMSGTSHGMIENTIPADGFPQESHFAFLERHNVSWKIYYHDDPWMAPAFADLRVPHRLALVQEMPAFYEDLKNGKLPQYVLIQPRMATSRTGPSNWQHPDNSVEQGEILTKTIYEALRESSAWENTLLIITYDEHGGFFDHQDTPTNGVPAPDSVLAPNGFDFTRLGVRIPTVMVSPWIAKGTVVSQPTGSRAPTSTSQYDATSIISSVNKIFGINETVSKREEWAGTFHDLVSGQGSRLRKDCPLTLPNVAPLSESQVLQEMWMPLNDHHYDSLNLLCHLSSNAHPVCAGFASTPALAREQRQYTSSLQQGTPSSLESAQPMPSTLYPAPLWSAALAHEFPALHGPAARRLRQLHFEDISKSMFDTYRKIAMARA